MYIINIIKALHIIHIFMFTFKRTLMSLLVTIISTSMFSYSYGSFCALKIKFYPFFRISSTKFWTIAFNYWFFLFCYDMVRHMYLSRGGYYRRPAMYRFSCISRHTAVHTVSEITWGSSLSLGSSPRSQIQIEGSTELPPCKKCRSSGSMPQNPEKFAHILQDFQILGTTASQLSYDAVKTRTASIGIP